MLVLPTTNGVASAKTKQATDVLAAVTALGAAAVGGIGLVGWFFAAPLLAGWSPKYIAIAPMSALLCLLLGITLFLLTWHGKRRLYRYALAAAGCFAVLIGTYTIIGFATGTQPLTDRLILNWLPNLDTQYRGDVSPPAGLFWALLGSSAVAIALLPRRAIGIWLALSGSIVGPANTIVLLGYLYGTPVLYGSPIRPIPLPLAVGFILLAAALAFTAGRKYFPLHMLSGDSARSRLLRAFLPIIGAVIILDGILARTLPREAGAATQAAISVLVFTVGSLLVVYLATRITGASIDKAEAERAQAEEEVRRLNERLATQVTELEAVNKELESFSYSVSHDLRAPLRAISGFAHVLSENLAERLRDDDARYLKIIQDNVARMDTLINDLLRLSRVGRQGIITKNVDMNALVQTVIEDLQRENSDMRATFEVEGLAPCLGDAVLLRQVLANLLGNAVKFSRNQPAPRVRIRNDMQGRTLVYRIEDNGVGFDMRYADKLFGAFQRLHGQKEFEGTGVGLAIVQRVIHRHGGDVWAESTPGEGAAFSFTLASRNPI